MGLLKFGINSNERINPCLYIYKFFGVYDLRCNEFAVSFVASTSSVLMQPLSWKYLIFHLINGNLNHPVSNFFLLWAPWICLEDLSRLHLHIEPYLSMTLFFTFLMCAKANLSSMGAKLDLASSILCQQYSFTRIILGCMVLAPATWCNQQFLINEMHLVASNL